MQIPVRTPVIILEEFRKGILGKFLIERLGKSLSIEILGAVHRMTFKTT